MLTVSITIKYAKRVIGFALAKTILMIFLGGTKTCCYWPIAVFCLSQMAAGQHQNLVVTPASLGDKPHSENEKILPLRTLNNVAWKSILEGIRMRDKSADDGTVSLTGVKLQGEIVGLIDEDSKNHGAPVMLRGAGDNREFAAAGQVMYMASPAVLTGLVKAGTTLSVVLCIGWTCNHYQWSRDGYDIAGATGSEYLVTPQDVGKNIQCFVRHMLNNGWPASPDFAVLTALQPK